MPTIENEINFALTMINLIDKEGPVQINMKLPMYHDERDNVVVSIYEQTYKNDEDFEYGVLNADDIRSKGVFTIGQENKKITKQDVIDLLDDIDTYTEYNHSDDDWYYTFGGLTTNTEGQLEAIWIHN